MKGCRKGMRTGGAREWSSAADTPSMPAGLGGATSGCLCSPLGRSACTNKPTPGLWSNGNQTCSRTKSPLSPSLLFFTPPLLSVWPKLCRHTLQLKDALQLSQTDLKIFPVPFPSFPTQQWFVTFRVSTSAPTFLTLKQPDSSEPHLSPQIHFLSLSHAYSITPPLSHSLLLHLYITHVRTKLSTDSCW